MKDNIQPNIEYKPLSEMFDSGKNIDDKCPWYAVKLFGSTQESVANYLMTIGLDFFVPMEYVDKLVKGEEKIKHTLHPVVKNLIFVKKTEEEKEMRRKLNEVPYKLSVMKKKDCLDYYEIPSKQMFEFRVMCNPDIAMRQYISEECARLKSGTPVSVKYGPLKGLAGKLVRQSKKYYLLNEVPGMGVMVKVSRWCCKAIDMG